MNRVWIAKPGEESDKRVTDGDYCAVWIELGEGRLMWILNNGKHGFSSDDSEDDPEDRLSARIARDIDDWEEL